MLDPHREPLEGVAEVDQAEIPFRADNRFFDPGKSAKILIAGAVERRCSPTGTDRIPGSPITDTTRGRSARWPAISCCPGCVFALMKRWALGTYHGLRRKHIDTYLNEFVFRYNRRFYRHVSFETVLGLASHHHPTSYWDIVGRDNPRKGLPTDRRGPRRRRTATGLQADASRPPDKLEPSPVSDLTRQP